MWYGQFKVWILDRGAGEDADPSKPIIHLATMFDFTKYSRYVPEKIHMSGLLPTSDVEAIKGLMKQWLMHRFKFLKIYEWWKLKQTSEWI